jgi:hypothetical protein
LLPGLSVMPANPAQHMDDVRKSEGSEPATAHGTTVPAIGLSAGGPPQAV